MHPRSILGAATVGLILGASAGAVVIPPGGVVAPAGTTLGQSPWIEIDWLGELVYNGIIPVTDQAGQEKLLQTLVYRHPVGALGDRACSSIYVGSAPDQSIRPVRFTISGYRGLAVNSDWRSDVLVGGGPTTKITRSADGDTLAFDLGQARTTHYVSMPIVVATDATRFANTGTLRLELNTGQIVVFENFPVPLAPCAGDANADGVINFADLNAVLSDFGRPCP